MRRFESIEDGASKFWEVAVKGTNLWVRWGKLGTTGQEKLKDLGAAAQREADKLVAEKLKKGYIEVGAKAAATPQKSAAAATAAKKPATTAAGPPAPKTAAKTAANPAPKSTAADLVLRETFWRSPSDRDALRVWADFLAESGDPRGEFMQLRMLENPTEAQVEKTNALEKKLGGKLVGPARPYVDYWSFDRNGMVNVVHCDGNKLVDGWEQIRWLNPRLTVCWTTLRTKTMATVAKVSALPLPEIYFLRIESGLTDRALAALAPALVGVKNLSLAYNELTPAGLAASAAHLASLEFLCVAPPISDRNPDAACNTFAEVIAASQPLHNLRAVQFYRHGKPDDAHVELLSKLPNMKRVVVAFYPPYDADSIDAWKRGEE